MKDNYDFSQGKQGKFCNPNTMFECPIYLELDANQFMTKLTIEKGVKVEILVNELLRNQINGIEQVT